MKRQIIIPTCCKLDYKEGPFTLISMKDFGAAIHCLKDSLFRLLQKMETKYFKVVIEGAVSKIKEITFQNNGSRDSATELHPNIERNNVSKYKKGW